MFPNWILSEFEKTGVTTEGYAFVNLGHAMNVYKPLTEKPQKRNPIFYIHTS